MSNVRWKIAEREKYPLRPGFTRNTGGPPTIKDGKRATVSLMNGRLCGDEPVTATTPTGWLVKTTRWSLTGAWTDVDQFKIL